MSRRKDKTNPSEKQPTKEEHHRIRSGNPVVDINDSDSASGSEAASVGEAIKGDINVRSHRWRESSIQRAVAEYEEGISELSSSGEGRTIKHEMSRQESARFSMEAFMRMMAEVEESRDKRREESERQRKEEEGLRREEERVRREEDDRQRREEERKRREEEREENRRIIQQLQEQVVAVRALVAAMPARPVIPNLPRLGAESSVDTFVTTFEAQLRLAGVGEDQWKLLLIGQLEEMHREKVAESIADTDSTYNDLITQLGRLDTETIASAEELLFDSEVNPDKIKTTVGALAKADQWLERLTEGVDDKKEALKRVS